MDARSIAAHAAASIGAHADVRSVALIGSTARGLGDDASDIDLLVLSSAVVDVEPPAPATRLFRLARPDGSFEKWRLASTLIDVEIRSCVAVSDELARVESGSTDPAAILIGSALHDAELLIGDPLPTVSYTDPLAIAQARLHLDGLVGSASIRRVSHKRGDVLAYAQRQADLSMRIVGLLGAINRVFVPAAAPKWLPYWIDRCETRPAKTLEVLEAAITNPSEPASGAVDDLLLGVLDLVDRHVPETSTAAARYALTLTP